MHCLHRYEIKCGEKMKISGKCPKCGNTDIRGPHRIQGQYHVKVDLPGIRTATFDSYTCTNCGYSELYTDRTGLYNLRNDGRIYRVQRESSKSSRQKTSSCPNCGAPISRSDTFCPNCGEKLN